MTLTVRQVYGLARSVGLSHERAVTATAIAVGESGLNPSAVGDTSLETDKWGPSVGLWQVRSLNAERGTGRARDASRLTDPTFNARAMYEISAGGREWGPWSVYTSGDYRDHLPAVRAAVGEGAGDGYSVDPAWSPNGAPIIPPWLNPLHPDNPGPSDDLARGLAGIGGDLRTVVLTGVLVAGGLALVVVGAGAASGPARRRLNPLGGDS